MKSKKKNVYGNVVAWPQEKIIPRELSDWLSYLIWCDVLEWFCNEFEDGEVLLIRYNLPKHQQKRGVPRLLFGFYTDAIVLQKVGGPKTESFNVWLNKKFTAIVRNGYAHGKYIYTKHYDRNMYLTSRIVSTYEGDIEDTVKLFPHAKRIVCLFPDKDDEDAENQKLEKLK